MDLVTLLLVVAGVAVGAVIGAMVVARRRAPGTVDVRPSAPRPQPPAAPEPVAPAPEPAPGPASPPEPEPAPEPATEPEPQPAPASAPASRPVRLRPRPARPAPPAVTRTTLRALAADAVVPDDAALAAAAASLHDGGVLVVEGEAPSATPALAALLRDALGDRDVVRVAPPGRHDRTDARGVVVGTAVHEPMRDVVDGTVGEDADAVLLVEHAERHLRRGLDPEALATLRHRTARRPVVLLLGATAGAGVIDDREQWLRGLAVRGAAPLGPDVADEDVVLDGALASLAERSPTGVDVVEAVAHAQAAGRLGEVPTSVVLRLAAGLAGGDPDAPVPPAALGTALEALDALDPDGDLLRVGGSDADGVPTTLATDARLVARCVPGVAELAAPLIAALLDDADDVERLTLARVLAAADDPRPALPALDLLVEESPTLAMDARLVRGVIGDRSGRADALGDYLAVADGGDRDLALHARFLAGGLLEVEGDVAAARDAYDAVVASDHQVHGPMAAFNLAWLDERDGDVDAALDAYRTLAGGEHPDAGPMAALNLASLLQRMKRFPESESWYRVAVDSRHADAAPMAAVALGLMLERRQRPREARTLFRYAASTGHEEAAPAALRRLGAPRR